MGEVILSYDGHDEDFHNLRQVEELVRCKDCKYYGCILYVDTQFEYGECFGHEESDYTFQVKPYDFCSRAERRTVNG